MQALTMGMHHKTPRLSVIDPRGLPIRSVDYWREVEGVPTQVCINRTFYDAAGRPVEQWDPRLWVLKQEEPQSPAHLTTVFSLCAFTFFLLAVDGEVNERRFLNSMTHFAEYDIEDDKAMEAGLGTGFKDVEFFASPDVLDPKHSSNLATVPMVKGRLKDLKSLLLGNSGISPVQLGRMDSRSLLNSIDGAFGGSLEIKIPGTIKVKTWNKKTTTSSVGKMAA